MESKIIRANAILWASSASFIFFGILNILKEANDGVKSTLNFYPPVGPLLGLFLSSALFLVVVYFVGVFFKIKTPKVAFWIFAGCSLAFFFLVFPPVFEPIVDFLKSFSS